MKTCKRVQETTNSTPTGVPEVPEGAPTKSRKAVPKKRQKAAGKKLSIPLSLARWASEWEKTMMVQVQ